jgi:hypothetical protein
MMTDTAPVFNHIHALPLLYHRWCQCASTPTLWITPKEGRGMQKWDHAQLCWKGDKFSLVIYSEGTVKRVDMSSSRTEGAFGGLMSESEGRTTTFDEIVASLGVEGWQLVGILPPMYVGYSSMGITTAWFKRLAVS